MAKTFRSKLLRVVVPMTAASGLISMVSHVGSVLATRVMPQAALVALVAAAHHQSQLHAEVPAPLDPVVGPSAVLPSAGRSGPVGISPTLLAEVEPIDLPVAMRQGTVKATIVGDGRDQANAQITNLGKTPLRLSIATGQVLESGRNLMVVVRGLDVEVEPGKTREMLMTAVALHSTNVVGESQYKLSYQSVPQKIGTFLAFARERLDLSAATLQTAVLALADNLPLSAVAKFAPATGAAASKFDTTAFKVETYDIIQALTALREAGIPDALVAMTVDPQLRIEAMIEPLARASAKRYYGITDEKEWEFWKDELLNGNAATRHYALYGIARFYPDVALEMMPKWAREVKTHPVYRLSAIQALADTQRREALPTLRQLAAELVGEEELAKAATQAADYLDNRLAQMSQRNSVVAFRGRIAANVEQ
jgi:hypothetical protein